MRLFSSDWNKSVDVGTASIWYSVYSTAMCVFSKSVLNNWIDALQFLKSGKCPVEKVSTVLEQIISVQQYFSLLSPYVAVYDLNKPEKKAPWSGNISPAVESCESLYTTADGKRLFDEVVELLEYALENNDSIIVS